MASVGPQPEYEFLHGRESELAWLAEVGNLLKTDLLAEDRVHDIVLPSEEQAPETNRGHETDLS